MAESLRGKTALVVGASSGIGRESAILLARAGARVMAAARREEALRTLESDSIRVAKADASKAAEMHALAQRTLDEFGRVDILVYSAGTNTPDRSMARLNAAGWDAMIATNLNGAYYITEGLLPGMRAARSGLMIFISSISGITADVSGAAYQASKRGLHGLAGAIRVEEKENGIRACVICPGLVDTEILDKRPVKPPPDVLAKALQASDVAEAVVFVAGLAARVAIPEMQILPAVL